MAAHSRRVSMCQLASVPYSEHHGGTCAGLGTVDSGGVRLSRRIHDARVAVVSLPVAHLEG
jgi:hypothetical protein